MGMTQEELEEMSAEADRKYREAVEKAQAKGARPPAAAGAAPGKAKAGKPRVARIVSAEALEHPAIEALFERMFSVDPFAKWAEAKETVLWMLGQPSTVAFLAVAGGEPVGAAMLQLPTSHLLPIPSVSHFYVDGRRSAVKNALIDAVVDFIAGSGYTRFVALNMSKLNDTAWKRVFREAGKARVVCSLMEFTIGA